jgi:uncharacterized membrane protein YdcZ (DUF606 family)
VKLNNKGAVQMKAVVNFSNILVAIILLLVGLAVFTRHRIASYVVGGFIMVLAAVSILSFLKILNVSSGPINIG